MASVVRLPSVLAGATEAAIARWLVSPGDAVAAGDPLAEIETEKALVEYAAEEAGVVGRIILAEGDRGEIGAPIAVLTREGDTDADIEAALRGAVPAAGRTPPRARVFASPIVRKIAAEQGLDLAAVTGTGPNGRIVRRDLGQLSRPPADTPAAGQPGAAGPHTLPPHTPSPHTLIPHTLIPHTPLRRAIARRLTESKATAPHFYLTADCVVDELLELRARVNKTAPVKVSVNDFVLMAAATAFRDVPEANVTWTEQGMLAYSSVDLSIAVATDGGLVTPVLRGVGAKRLTEIAAEARELAQRARDGRLRQHELEGGVFSVSNLGMYGTRGFAAIINPPQSAILAVGAATPQPAVVGGTLAVATVMRCTLSVDHRAIDGALAARWLAAFCARVADPLGTIT